MRLNYASQQANKRDRAADRSWDLRRALGCEVGFLSAPAEYIQKPKGVHWRTLDRKIAQLRHIEGRALDDGASILAGIDRKLRIARKTLARCHRPNKGGA